MKKQSAEERFYAKVNKLGRLMPHMKTRCHEWTAHVGKDGYGRFTLDGNHPRAHVAAWLIAHGSTHDLDVLHACDNPACVRLSHLSLGTHQENMADMVRKGRSATGARNGRNTRPDRTARGDRHGFRLHPEAVPRGDRHGFRLHPGCAARGSKSGKAKLVEAQVLELRAKSAAGATNTQLAKEYNLTWNGVKAIVVRKAWQHI